MGICNLCCSYIVLKICLLRVEPDFLGFLIRILLHVESQGTEKIKFFSQGTNTSRNLRYEGQVIADYDCVKIFSLTVRQVMAERW